MVEHSVVYCSCGRVYAGRGKHCKSCSKKGVKRPDLAEYNKTHIRKGNEHWLYKYNRKPPALGKHFSAEFSSKLRIRIKAMWDDPDSKFHTDEYWLKRAEAIRRLHRDPNSAYNSALCRLKKSVSMQKAIERGCFQEKLVKGISRPERVLLAALNSSGLAPISQYPFKGFYIDFAFPDKKLFVEVDGEYWHSLPGRKQKDSFLDMLSDKYGYRMLRFSDKEVLSDSTRVVTAVASAIALV